MAEKLDPKEIVTFEKPSISNSIQIEALTQLLVEKGLINFQEVFEKLKQVQGEYQSMKNHQETYIRMLKK